MRHQLLRHHALQQSCLRPAAEPGGDGGRDQLDLFAVVPGYDGETGAPQRVAPVLRPDVLQEVGRVIRINQPPAAWSAHAG
jgi:hypothetical protein